MQLYESPNQRQPDTESAATTVGFLITLGEEIENPRKQVSGDSVAVIFDTQDRSIALRSYDEKNFAVSAIEVMRPAAEAKSVRQAPAESPPARRLRWPDCASSFG